MSRYGRRFTLPPTSLSHLIGNGCKFCQDGKPVAHSICQSCWIQRFGWTWEKITRWLGRQDRAYERIQERDAAMQLWREERNPDGIIRYAEHHGVWLVPEEELNL